MASMKLRLPKLTRLAPAAIAALLYMPFAAHAALAGGALETGLYNVIELLTGSIARALAILAAMAFGIGALSGRVDWIKAVTVILGIGVVFSAETLVRTFFGK